MLLITTRGPLDLHPGRKVAVVSAQLRNHLRNFKRACTSTSIAWWGKHITAPHTVTMRHRIGMSSSTLFLSSCMGGATTTTTTTTKSIFMFLSTSIFLILRCLIPHFWAGEPPCWIPSYPPTIASVFRKQLIRLRPQPFHCCVGPRRQNCIHTRCIGNGGGQVCDSVMAPPLHSDAVHFRRHWGGAQHLVLKDFVGVSLEDLSRSREVVVHTVEAHLHDVE
mmetsp:Transcript_6855/g.9469  ORF Transcript_6855/g.9469 Transcript_6855/m.9469 type:complete len:221 (+) Transcript_6855:99-761(+)